MRVATRLGLLIAIFALGAHTSAIPAAQSTAPASNLGRLKGLVLDQGGASIPAAVIVIEAGGFRREVGHTEDGSYQVDLPAGRYRITVRSDGFHPVRGKKVRIRAGLTKTVDFRLKGIRVDESHP